MSPQQTQTPPTPPQQQQQQPGGGQLATTPPQPQQRQLPPYHGTNPFVHNVALGVTPVALLALFLPPRRLDLRLGVLGGVALWGTNQLVHDYSGTSSLRWLGRRLQSLSPDELPEKAKETQARLRVERARRLQQQQQQQEAAAAAAAAAGLSEEQSKRLIEEQRRKLKEEEERGILERVWMGDSGEDWKEKRDRREKEALSEGGGGYWGLITDQISEAWNMGKKKEEGEGKTQEKGNEPTKKS
ncbi:hypothetical protein Hte_006113 [Hypoxylon texense]